MLHNLGQILRGGLMAEEKKEWGGKRPGAGRKPIDLERSDELVRRMVTLPADVVERLLAMDPSGRYKKRNLSLGILEALRQLDGGQEKK